MNQDLYESLSKKAAQLMPADRLNPYDYSLYMKILAELIVRECADIAGRYGTPDGYYIAAEINRIMLNIRTDKGFGVE